MKRQNMEYKDNQLFHNNEDIGYSVIQDEIYPKMWRIKFPDGKLSDMANFTRTRYKLKGYLAEELNYGLEDLGTTLHSLKQTGWYHGSSLH